MGESNHRLKVSNQGSGVKKCIWVQIKSIIKWKYSTFNNVLTFHQPCNVSATNNWTWSWKGTFPLPNLCNSNNILNLISPLHIWSFWPSPYTNGKQFSFHKLDTLDTNTRHYKSGWYVPWSPLDGIVNVTVPQCLAQWRWLVPLHPRWTISLLSISSETQAACCSKHPKHAHLSRHITR